jgi:hypothetical protein
MAKRRFGRVRQLPSGRWQARYQGPDGIDRAAPETFAAKTDAEVWLTLKEAEIFQGDWINLDDGKVLVAASGFPARCQETDRTGEPAASGHVRSGSKAGDSPIAPARPMVGSWNSRTLEVPGCSVRRKNRSL